MKDHRFLRSALLCLYFFRDALVHLKPEPEKIQYISSTTTVNWMPLFYGNDFQSDEVICSVKEIEEKLKTEKYRDRCTLDQSQIDAVMSCFSRPLTLIQVRITVHIEYDNRLLPFPPQGPPGTGKTFLGVMITRLLLSANTLPAGPILVMAYKNRSLDHFLNLCCDFVDAESVVRVGHSSHPQLGDRCLSVVLHREKLRNKQLARRIHFDSIFRLKELKTR